MYFQTSCFHSNGHNGTNTNTYNYKYTQLNLLSEREYSFMIACLIAWINTFIFLSLTNYAIVD